MFDNTSAVGNDSHPWLVPQTINGCQLSRGRDGSIWIQSGGIPHLFGTSLSPPSYRQCMKGSSWQQQAWVKYEAVYNWSVSHLSTNLTQRTVSWLMSPTILPLSQTNIITWNMAEDLKLSLHSWQCMYNLVYISSSNPNRQSKHWHSRGNIFYCDSTSSIGVWPWRPQTMMATNNDHEGHNHDGHKHVFWRRYDREFSVNLAIS